MPIEFNPWRLDVYDQKYFDSSTLFKIPENTKSPHLPFPINTDRSTFIKLARGKLTVLNQCPPLANTCKILATTSQSCQDIPACLQRCYCEQIMKIGRNLTLSLSPDSRMHRECIESLSISQHTQCTNSWHCFSNNIP
jgi:hypothetical protein